MKSDRGLTAHFGVSGSGKTEAMKQSIIASVLDGSTVIVLDRQKDWRTIPPELHNVSAQVKNVSEAFAATREGARLVTIPGIPNATIENADALARWAVERGEIGPDGNDYRGVAIPEAHRMIATHATIPENLDNVVSAWRHYRASLWVDAQRISRLSTHITENAATVRIFAQYGNKDRERVADLAFTKEGEIQLVNAVVEASRILGRSGKMPPPPEDAGWHVELRHARLPPYVLQRMNGPGRVPSTRATVTRQQRMAV